MAEERLEAAAADEYTQDGTVDLHGNPVLRSKRGGWKACGFVVGTQAASYPIYHESLCSYHGLCFRAPQSFSTPLPVKCHGEASTRLYFMFENYIIEFFLR